MRGPQKSPIASARPVCRRPTAPRCASPARNWPRTCARTWILHSRRPNRCAQVTSMTVGRAKRAAREREANKAAARELATGDAPIDASPASHTAASSTSTSPSRRPRRKVAGKRKRGRPPLSPAEKVASMERRRLNDRARRAPRGEGGSDQRKQQPRRDQSQPAPSAKVQPPPLMPPLPHREPHAEHAHRLLAHRTYDERCSVDRACADARRSAPGWGGGILGTRCVGRLGRAVGPFGPGRDTNCVECV